MKSYFNEKGEQVVIEKMANNYLLNAMAKYKKELDELRSKGALVANDRNLVQYIEYLQDLTKSLKKEIERRGLI